MRRLRIKVARSVRTVLGVVFVYDHKTVVEAKSKGLSYRFFLLSVFLCAEGVCVCWIVPIVILEIGNFQHAGVGGLSFVVYFLHLLRVSGGSGYGKDGGYR